MSIQLDTSLEIVFLWPFFSNPARFAPTILSFILLRCLDCYAAAFSVRAPPACSSPNKLFLFLTRADKSFCVSRASLTAWSLLLCFLKYFFSFDVNLRVHARLDHEKASGSRLFCHFLVIRVISGTHAQYLWKLVNELKNQNVCWKIRNASIWPWLRKYFWVWRLPMILDFRSMEKYCKISL